MKHINKKIKKLMKYIKEGIFNFLSYKNSYKYYQIIITMLTRSRLILKNFYYRIRIFYEYLYIYFFKVLYIFFYPVNKLKSFLLTTWVFNFIRYIKNIHIKLFLSFFFYAVAYLTYVSVFNLILHRSLDKLFLDPTIFIIKLFFLYGFFCYFVILPDHHNLFSKKGTGYVDKVKALADHIIDFIILPRYRINSFYEFCVKFILLFNFFCIGSFGVVNNSISSLITGYSFFVYLIFSIITIYRVIVLSKCITPECVIKEYRILFYKNNLNKKKMHSYKDCARLKKRSLHKGDYLRKAFKYARKKYVFLVPVMHRLKRIK